MSNYCHVCRSFNVDLVEFNFKLKYISSDLKVVESDSKIFDCKSCHNLVKKIDNTYLEELNRIYNDYKLYKSTNNIDQKILKGSQSISRSQILIEKIKSKLNLKNTGKFLDYGTGRGAFLKIWQEFFPEWESFGFEKNILEVESFLRKHLISTEEGIPSKLDFISLIHVLEHLIDPLNELKLLREKLTDDGYLFIQVPNLYKNPYDLTILDHCTHFNVDSLCDLIELAGFEVVYLSTIWINKDISLIAKKKDKIKITIKNQRIDSKIFPNYLSSVINYYLNLKQKSLPLGILGVTNPSYWLSIQTENINDFYLDENKDPAIQISLNGKPVFNLNQLMTKSLVFIPFLSLYASPIKKRLKNKTNKLDVYFLKNDII